MKFPVDILKDAVVKYFENRSYKPDPKGLLTTRKAISKYYSESRSLNLEPEDIVITSSTSESYNLLFSLFTKPGDEILLPSPSYPLFSYFAEFNKIKVKYYKLDKEKNWEIDIESLEKNVSKKTKFIVLISPNNPTGQILSQKQYEQICKIAEQHNIYVIFDEVFSEYDYQKTTNKMRCNKSESIIFRLNGISKMFALPDLKLSWILVEGERKRVGKIIEKLETANDMFLNANYITQSMIPEIFEGGREFKVEMIKTLRRKAETMNKALAKQNRIKSTPISGGINMILSLEKSKTSFDEEEFVLELLEKHHILIHPGYFYDYGEQKYLNFVVTIFNAEKIAVLISCINQILDQQNG